MDLTSREFWGLVHGIGLGSIYLLAFSAGWTWLRSYRADLVTPTGVEVRHWRRPWRW